MYTGAYVLNPPLSTHTRTRSQSSDSKRTVGLGSAEVALEGAARTRAHDLRPAVGACAVRIHIGMPGRPHPNKYGR